MEDYAVVFLVTCVLLCMFVVFGFIVCVFCWCYFKCLFFFNNYFCTPCVCLVTKCSLRTLQFCLYSINYGPLLVYCCLWDFAGL